MKRKNEAQNYYGTIGLVLLTMMVLLDLAFSLMLLAFREYLTMVIIILVFTVPLLSVMTYYFIAYFHYRNAEYIDIQTIRFDSIEFSFFIRNRAALVGYAVIDGTRTRIETTYTFSTNVLSGYVASNYLAKDLTVGYDPKWDKWVVFTD